MKRLLYLLSFLFLTVGMTIAQTTRVTGTVTSSEDGEPVVGATIVVKGTTTGTITNYDGQFSLDIPSGAKTLVVSYIGMTTKEVAVSRSVRVTLESNMQDLDEVVITAM